MDPRTKRLALTVLGSLVVAFTLFCVSVAVWGSWWRFDGMPTPEEWSALFGASALVALALAWYQIRQVDQSNRELIASNELARQVNLETVRPKVQVTFDAERVVSKRRGGPVGGSLFLAIENIGASPAFDVRFKVDAPFASREEYFRPDRMAGQLSKINALFNGTVSFQTLNPGRKYIWYIGQIPDFFGGASDLPSRWEVEAEYRGTSTRHAFQDTLILDRDLEWQLEVPVNPLARIGKDLEVIGDKLEKGRKVSHEDFASLGEVVSGGRRGVGGQRHRRGSRRAPRWTRR